MCAKYVIRDYISCSCNIWTFELFSTFFFYTLLGDCGRPLTHKTVWESYSHLCATSINNAHWANCTLLMNKHSHVTTFADHQVQLPKAPNNKLWVMSGSSCYLNTNPTLHSLLSLGKVLVYSECKWWSIQSKNMIRYGWVVLVESMWSSYKVCVHSIVYPVQKYNHNIV